MSLEDTFAQWSKPPSDTEDTKCENARVAIAKAISASAALSVRSLSVFGQGSYAANTNVRLDSDVDVCVLCKDTFFFDLPSGSAPNQYGVSTPAAYPFSQYKDDVHRALVRRFGEAGVDRGGKAFDVHSNTYRVDSDAVPCFEYRYYPGSLSEGYISGVAFIDEKSDRRIFNYPVQALENGRAKNVETGRRYKRVVRILKCLRNVLKNEGSVVAGRIPSFLVECLVYRVPSSHFQNSSLTQDVHDVLYFLLGNIASDETCVEWTETNEIKYLFRAGQPWSRQDAFTFAWDATQRLKI